mgnify:CR=1 FL=1
MKIQLRELEKGHTQFTGTIDEDIFGLNDPNCVPEGGYRYDVEGGQLGSSLWVHGLVEASFKLRCVSCLELFDFPIVLPDFATQIEHNGSEIADLTAEVREDILLALPTHPHCDWAGTVECPGEIPKAIAASEEPPVADSGSAWDALKKLDI